MSKAMVKDCPFGVSPVNYLDSDSDTGECQEINEKQIKE